jgi:hypothetical protein
MGGDGIAVIEIRERLQVQLRFSLTAEPERGVPTCRVERAYRSELIKAAHLSRRVVLLDGDVQCYLAEVSDPAA